MSLTCKEHTSYTPVEENPYNMKSTAETGDWPEMEVLNQSFILNSQRIIFTSDDSWLHCASAITPHVFASTNIYLTVLFNRSKEKEINLLAM